MATFRKRGKGWQAQVRKAAARPVSKTFQTLAAAKAWATSVERDIEKGEWFGGHAAGTVGDLIRRYRDEAATMRPLRRNKLGVLRKLEAGLGAVRLRDLDVGAVAGFAKARRREGAGPATVAMDLSYLAAVLETARSLWRLPVTPEPVRQAKRALTMVGTVARSGTRDRRPTPEELARLLAHLRGRPRQGVPIADIAEFAVASGMRLGEICRLRWGDLDERRRLILVRERKDPRNKGSRNELVPLLPVAGYDALALILARPRDGDLIWPYKPESVSAGWIRACDDLGVADLHFHDLRAECISRAFEAGLTIEQVALMSGHRTWSMLRRYARLRPADLAGRYVPAPPATSEEPQSDRRSTDPT